jgi:hypothetical protein
VQFSLTEKDSGFAVELLTVDHPAAWLGVITVAVGATVLTYTAFVDVALSIPPAFTHTL